MLRCARAHIIVISVYYNNLLAYNGYYFKDVLRYFVTRLSSVIQSAQCLGQIFTVASYERNNISVGYYNGSE